MREKGITKYQLKENADISSTIYQWKKNATRDKQRVPSLRSIEKICEYFDVSLSYFFAFDASAQRDIKNEEVMELILKLNDEQLNLILQDQLQLIHRKMILKLQSRLHIHLQVLQFLAVSVALMKWIFITSRLPLKDIMLFTQLEV